MNRDNHFGFLSSDPEPVEFLSVEEIVKTEYQIESEAGFSATFHLADNKYVYERSVYTFFALIGDVGGFNSAIIILPTFLMTIYSERMYQGAL